MGSAERLVGMHGVSHHARLRLNYEESAVKWGCADETFFQLLTLLNPEQQACSLTKLLFRRRRQLVEVDINLNSIVGPCCGSSRQWRRLELTTAGTSLRPTTPQLPSAKRSRLKNGNDRRATGPVLESIRYNGQITKRFERRIECWGVVPMELWSG